MKSKIMHTSRKKQNIVKLTLIEAILRKPNFSPQTKDFLKIANKYFGIKQRQTIIRHLNNKSEPLGLRQLGLIRYNSSTQSYSLPDNFRTFTYLKALNDKLGIVVDHLVPLYAKEVQEEYYKTLHFSIKETERKKWKIKQLEIKNVRKIELVSGLLYSVHETYLDALLLLDGLDVDSKRKEKARKIIDKFKILTRNYLNEVKKHQTPLDKILFE